MYSRHTGVSSGYSAEYLRAKYAEKNAARQSPFKAAQQPPVQETAEVKDITVFEENKDSTPEETGLSGFISSLEGDDLLLLAVLAFLLFSDGEKKNLDLILAAALIFIEFG